MTPSTRSDCGAGPRPCPWRPGRHYLGAGLCMLDLVEQHPDGMSQPDIGDLLGVTRQRVQQIEARAVRRAGRLPRIAGVREAA